MQKDNISSNNKTVGISNPDSFGIALPVFRPLAVLLYSFGTKKRASCTVLGGLAHRNGIGTAMQKDNISSNNKYPPA